MPELPDYATIRKQLRRYHDSRHSLEGKECPRDGCRGTLELTDTDLECTECGGF